MNKEILEAIKAQLLLLKDQDEQQFIALAPAFAAVDELLKKTGGDVRVPWCEGPYQVNYSSKIPNTFVIQGPQGPPTKNNVAATSKLLAAAPALGKFVLWIMERQWRDADGDPHSVELIIPSEIYKEAYDAWEHIKP